MVAPPAGVHSLISPSMFCFACAACFTVPINALIRSNHYTKQTYARAHTAHKVTSKQAFNFSLTTSLVPDSTLAISCQTQFAGLFCKLGADRVGYNRFCGCVFSENDTTTA